MDKNQDLSYLQKEMEREKKFASEFFAILKDFKNLDYESRVNYIKEKYGKIEPKKIYFGKSYYIEIIRDADKKYHFTFDCENGDINLFKETFPELKELVENNEIDEIKKIYPNMEKIKCPLPNEEVDTTVESLASNFLEVYNNLNIENK